MIKTEEPPKSKNRADALWIGETRYIGSVCINGHDGWRWTGSGNCIQCLRDKYKVKHANKPRKTKGRTTCPIKEEAKIKGEAYYSTNKPCNQGHISKRRTANGECVECNKNRYKKNGEAYSIKSKYDISLEERDKMLKAQNNLCALCGNEEVYIDKATKKIKKLSIDHCHKTGKIRGILCSPCNMGIGLLQHDPKLLRKAAVYCE